MKLDQKEIPKNAEDLQLIFEDLEYEGIEVYWDYQEFYAHDKGGNLKVYNKNVCIPEIEKGQGTIELEFIHVNPFNKDFLEGFEDHIQYITDIPDKRMKGSTDLEVTIEIVFKNADTKEIMISSISGNPVKVFKTCLTFDWRAEL